MAVGITTSLKRAVLPFPEKLNSDFALGKNQMTSNNQYAGLKGSVLSCGNTLRALIKAIEHSTKKVCPKCMIIARVKIDRIYKHAHETSFVALFNMWADVETIDFCVIVNHLSDYPALAETSAWFMREFYAIVHHMLLMCRDFKTHKLPTDDAEKIITHAEKTADLEGTIETVSRNIEHFIWPPK
jgi:hypothetical protein